MIKLAIPKQREARLGKRFTWSVEHRYDTIVLMLIRCAVVECAYGREIHVPVLDFVHDPIGTRKKLARAIRSVRERLANDVAEPTIATLELHDIMSRVRAESEN